MTRLAWSGIIVENEASVRIARNFLIGLEMARRRFQTEQTWGSWRRSRRHAERYLVRKNMVLCLAVRNSQIVYRTSILDLHTGHFDIPLINRAPQVGQALTAIRMGRLYCVALLILRVVGGIIDLEEKRRPADYGRLRRLLEIRESRPPDHLLVHPINSLPARLSKRHFHASKMHFSDHVHDDSTPPTRPKTGELLGRRDGVMFSSERLDKTFSLVDPPIVMIMVARRRA